MRLATLLATLSDAELDRLAAEHVRPDGKLARPQLCNFLEGAIRDPGFVTAFVMNRRPPAYAILALLLDAPSYELPADTFRERVMAETERIKGLLDTGELLARDNGLRLYRSALAEALRSELDISESEAGLLGVLRRESRILLVEHFLIAHHRDLREFWETPDCFECGYNALRSAGLVFERDSCILLPEDVAPSLFQSLGIDMPTDAARRLFEFVGSTELANALEGLGLRSSGGKAERIERVLTERLPPREVLDYVSVAVLRDICRDGGASGSGNKDQLIDRIITHFAQGMDQQEEEPAEPPRHEPRRLDEGRFNLLFGCLKHRELSEMLRRFARLRQSGSKDTRIATLWGAHLSEETLLSELMSRDLKAVLDRLDLRISGSKNERIARLIGHFAGTEGAASPGEAVVASAQPVSASNPECARVQEQFRQKASSSQGALQGWLEQVLEAPGKVRCYATEVPNPTQQLKNKLSQAAAAQGGVLVLTLADDNAFGRANDALIERWGSNDEWPKGIACVALAYPTSHPAIRSVVEWTDSPWPERIRDRLFPSVRTLRARHSHSSATMRARDAEVHAESKHSKVPLIQTICGSCGIETPVRARFCPQCGTPLAT